MPTQTRRCRRSPVASLIALPLFAVAAALTACQSDFRSEETRAAETAALESSSEAAISAFRDEDPTLSRFFDSSIAWAVFPDAGRGGFIVGGGGGDGVVFEGGRRIGLARMSFATVGAQAGGQSFRQIIFFQTPEALARFKENRLEFAANASAVAVQSGGAASADWSEGVAVFVMPKAGLMLDASIGGQRFRFIPD